MTEDPSSLMNVSNYPGEDSMSILHNVENIKSNNVIRDIRIGGETVLPKSKGAKENKDHENS
jgi:hypothetical protein